MTHQMFADGVGSISVTGGVVRIQLVTVLPNQRDAQGRMASEVQGTLVMPLEGYLRTAVALQQGVQELIKAGVVKVTPAEPAPAPIRSATPPAAPAVN